MSSKAKDTEAGPSGHQVPVRRFVTLNDKGGVAKTLAAQGVYAQLLSQGIPAYLIEVEVERRLAELFAGVSYHPLGDEKATDYLNNPLAGQEFWDRVIMDFVQDREQITIMDISANATKAMWSWATDLPEVADAIFGTGAGIGALVMATTDPKAVDSAYTALRGAALLWPDARLYLVVSNHDGEIGREAAVWDRICSAAGDRADDVIRVFLPKCPVRAWSYVRELKKPLAEAIMFPPRWLVETHGYTLPAAIRERHYLVEWLASWRTELQKIIEAGGILPGR